MPSILVLTEPLPAPGMRLLAGRSDVAVRVLDAPTAGALRAALPDADGVVMMMEQPALTADLVERAPRLRVACRMGAGYDNFDVPALTRRRIPLATVGAANAATVAEHALYLMLALARRGPSLDRAVHGGAWPRALVGVELAGLTCLVVGYGRIGREIARRAAAFDMSVWGVSRSGTGDTTHAEKIAPVSQFRELLPHADYIVISAPETPETFHLIGAQELSLLKPSAFLINLARGSLLDQTAFIAALRENKLAGAALDVTDPEPPPPSDPIWKAPNLFITPHTSAISDRLWPRETSLLLDLLERWFDGRELFNLVDLHRGY